MEAEDETAEAEVEEREDDLRAAVAVRRSEGDSSEREG